MDLAASGTVFTAFYWIYWHIIALWGAVLPVPLDPTIQNTSHLQTVINIR